MPDKKCVIEFYKKIPQDVKEMTDRLYTIYPEDKLMYVFTFSGDWFGLIPSAGGNYEQKFTGTWECKGNDNFIITTETHTLDSDATGWVKKPVTDNSDFSCILKNKGNTANVDSNGEYAWYWADQPNKVAHIFFKDGKWQQTKENQKQYDGRWNCDEDNHFLIVSNDGDSYSSRNNNWEKILTFGDPNDSFPLRIGSEGPNVVKLQKFLNDRIRTNPLTVNGRFDQNTMNKLIEFQKKEGIIE